MFREGIPSLEQESGTIYIPHHPKLKRVVCRLNNVQSKDKEVGILQETCSTRILLMKVLHWLSVLWLFKYIVGKLTGQTGSAWKEYTDQEFFYFLITTVDESKVWSLAQRRESGTD